MPHTCHSGPPSGGSVRRLDIRLHCSLHTVHSKSRLEPKSSSQHGVKLMAHCVYECSPPPSSHTTRFRRECAQAAPRPPPPTDHFKAYVERIRYVQTVVRGTLDLSAIEKCKIIRMAPAFSKMGVWNQRTTSEAKKEIFVMYHSTPTCDNVEGILNNGFVWSEPTNMLGHGIYVSSTLQKAVGYGKFTFKLLVYPGRVCRIDRQGHPKQKSWHSDYSTAWVPPNCGMVPSGHQVYRIP